MLTVNISLLLAPHCGRRPTVRTRNRGACRGGSCLHVTFLRPVTCDCAVCALSPISIQTQLHSRRRSFACTARRGWREQKSRRARPASATDLPVPFVAVTAKGPLRSRLRDVSVAQYLHSQRITTRAGRDPFNVLKTLPSGV
jgi:hypothetical protein